MFALLGLLATRISRIRGDSGHPNALHFERQSCEKKTRILEQLNSHNNTLDSLHFI